MTSSKPTAKGIRNVPAPQGGKPASVYSRFIPREELADFAAWTPGMLETGDAAAQPRTAPSSSTATRRASRRRLLSNACHEGGSVSKVALPPSMPSR